MWKNIVESRQATDNNTYNEEQKECDLSAGMHTSLIIFNTCYLIPCDLAKYFTATLTRTDK